MLVKGISRVSAAVTARNFSRTFTRQQIIQNSIFMRQTIPTKLTVPFGDDLRMELSVNGDSTVAQF